MQAGKHFSFEMRRAAVSGRHHLYRFAAQGRTSHGMDSGIAFSNTWKEAFIQNYMCTWRRMPPLSFRCSNYAIILAASAGFLPQDTLNGCWETRVQNQLPM